MPSAVTEIFYNRFFLYFPVLKLHLVGSRLFTIIAISLVATCLLTMSVVSQHAEAATLGAPTGLKQCVQATETTISLCWTAPAEGANPKIRSYILLNATETCSGSGGDYTCSFGNFQSAYHWKLDGTGGLNATTGTGSAATVANFTGLSAGDMFKFKIIAYNAHGNGTLSSAFQAGTLLPGDANYANRPTQSFANGTTFGSGTSFAANQEFSNFQNFGANQVFGAGTTFAEGQTFNGSQNLTGANLKFDDSAQFDTAQTFGDGANFTGSTTFTGANTFGDNVKFGHGANFKDGVQTFGAGGNFSGIFEMIAGNTFGAATIFADDQPFVGSQTFTAADMKFGSGTSFDTVQTFGEGFNFTGKATFTGTNTFGANAVFGDASVFPASQSFGKGANFTGITTFSGTQAFPQAAEFAKGQTFGAGTDFTFDDFAMFNAGTDFGKARTFDPGAIFDSTMTFYENTVFSANSKIGDGQAFTAAMTFGEDVSFGANADFTALAQTFAAGTSFGDSAQFAVGQVMPTNTLPPQGMMLAPFTCLDADCNPPANLVISPGEFIPPGTNPVKIEQAITNSSKDVDLPGLGFIMNFTTITGTGSASVDPMDPAELPGASAAATNTASGSSGVKVAGLNFDTIGTALDISAGTATVSGDIQITMPYDASTFAEGVTAGDLSVLHYITGTSVWEEVANCTVDEGASNITCTGITSLSPFTLGSKASAGNTGGMACDTTAYGPGKSLAVYEINWDIFESNEVQVIAGSKCGPIKLQVFTQSTIATGGLAQEQPYLDDNKVVVRAPVSHTTLAVGPSESFRILVSNGWNSFDQTIYTDLHGSSGTILINFQKQDYSYVKLFMDDEPQLAAAPSSGMFVDPEPQLVMEAVDHTILRPNYDAEPQLTPAEMEIRAATHSDVEPQLTEQERQTSFLDWFFSLFS